MTEKRLIINKLTRAQYEQSSKDPNQIWLITDDSETTILGRKDIDNTKIYSTKTTETSPQHGDRKLLGNGEMWEYGSVYNFQVTLDNNDPQKDTREVTIVEKLYLNESKTIGWLYIITMDGDKDLAPSLWFPEKKDTFTFGYDYGNFTGSAVRNTEPELGWKFTGQMVSENLMVDYVDSAIGQVLTTEVF